MAVHADSKKYTRLVFCVMIIHNVSLITVSTNFKTIIDSDNKVSNNEHNRGRKLETGSDSNLVHRNRTKYDTFQQERDLDGKTK